MEYIVDILHRFLLFLETMIIEILNPASSVGMRVKATLITTIVITVVVKPVSAILRELWLSVATRHDASALAYLGCEENVLEFGDATLFPDSPRYSTINGTVIPHNDPRDVIGFVAGSPRWLEESKEIDQKGYYAYLIINWQMYEQLRIWTKRGYGIQKVALLDDEGNIDNTRVDSRHLVITPFSEEGKYIFDICEGPLRVIRWQPYKTLGFEYDRLDICTLSAQVRIWVWFGAVLRISRHNVSNMKSVLSCTRMGIMLRGKESKRRP